jgi:hypothetical protein
MSRNFYSEINLHMTWHTKESYPMLVPQVEAVVHHYLRGRCINTPGVFVTRSAAPRLTCICVCRRCRRS